MNFEELLATRDARKTTKLRLPYGFFYKRLIDGKYSNFVEFHDEVADQLLFGKCVMAECEELSGINIKQQLRFTSNEDDEGVYALAVEPGNYITIEQLLNEQPSKVVQAEFMNQTLRDLFEATKVLNERGIYHLCFAPSNVLVRKNDGAVRLLSHGSFYLKTDQDVLWEGVEDYVAPEVLNGEQVDNRADVYSLGKFARWLYQSAGLPIELQHVVNKATSRDPNERYVSVEKLADAINLSRRLKRSALLGGAAAAIALLILGLFFYLTPKREVMEYVRPVEEPISDELMDDELEEQLFGIGADADSATIAEIVQAHQEKKDSANVDERKMREFNAKAEAIFRRQFTKAADEILSQVYNEEMMNKPESDFALKNRQMTEELAKKQEELQKMSSLTPDRTQAIASQIIEQITRKKMEMLDKDYMGLKSKQDD